MEQKMEVRQSLTGAALVCKALCAEGVRQVFGYPGGQVIDLFDALADTPALELILPRHEQGMVHMADGYARTTGKVGVCIATSGPGATNLTTGVATAYADSIPLVCIAGQVPTALLERRSFQEVDVAAVMRSICKQVFCVRRREELARTVQEAFRVAREGKPGPVVIELPKDIQQALGEDCYPPGASAGVTVPALDERRLEAVAERLRLARKPVILAGGGVHLGRAEAELEAFAIRAGIPVVTTLMGMGSLPTAHPLWVGNLGIHGSVAANRAVSECDVLLAIGARFNDRITGRPGTFAPEAYLIHVELDASAISRNIAAGLALVADAKAVLRALLQRQPEGNYTEWRAQIDGWKQAYPLAMGEGFTPECILRAVGKAFPGALFVADVGQNQLWAGQFLELARGQRLLLSGGLGTMGYGLPAAIGAKLAAPERPVVCITGDGGLQMNLQELTTAAALELPLLICVLQNTVLGNVRQWQKMFYGGRYSGTCLRGRRSCAGRCGQVECPPYLPDLVRLAESCGVAGFRATQDTELLPALRQARQAKGPVLLECCVSPEWDVLPIVPPGAALDEMRLE